MIESCWGKSQFDDVQMTVRGNLPSITAVYWQSSPRQKWIEAPTVHGTASCNFIYGVRKQAIMPGLNNLFNKIKVQLFQDVTEEVFVSGKIILPFLLGQCLGFLLLFLLWFYPKELNASLVPHLVDNSFLPLSWYC